MVEQHEKTLVPQIRFAGFTDPWEQRKLGELASKRIEKNSNGIKETFTNSAEHGVVSQLDYFDHDITNDANIGNYSVVYPDDFVYNPRISTIAPCGPINRNKLGRNGVMSPLYTVFSVDDMISKLYLEHYFKTNRWHQFMFLEGNSGARSDRFSISDSIFFEMPIQCPVLEEQELIASFFDRLDSLITLHQRKYDKLCVLKKSMLDKMFPKGGSLYPEIRFAGFTDPWEQRKLGELFEESDERASDREILSVSVANGIYPASESDRETNPGASLANYKIVHFGDVVYNSMRMWQGAVDASRYDGIVSPAYVVARPNSEVYARFFARLLRQPMLLKQYQQVSQGNSKDTQVLKFDDFASIGISMPVSENEQRRIGGFFDRLDSLITLHQRKLELLRNIKKSMLDKMFV
ncbi:Type I restriction modification DNA specificity d omain protein [Bifidobacterium pseudocatenulatum]|uniref:restriction endonuclease subunit S n=1 Tax=Bifidobacterium pseudocatenulatum TaxID=28026 RepID=UPI00144A377E|nr:restriction endonuclease subunit S [Bifidobacterium pseudocatenulatum]VWQ13598.1 Type I restriction modification DNA specificity d omain protein [Bifidobacterium pseudocatenulatum]